MIEKKQCVVSLLLSLKKIVLMNETMRNEYLDHEDDKDMDVLDEEGENSLKPDKIAIDNGTIYPTKVIFSREMFSVYELKRRCEDRKSLILDPDYQRDDVWNNKRKSELIESILMGMPLPMFYFFADENGEWQVIDGRQRLTTLFDYINGEFKLINQLNILHAIRQKYFKDLKPIEQGIIEDYSLQINIIKPPTPDRVKFDIFDRVNRGGIRLNNQEMRNAIYQGQATELLNKLSKNPDFLSNIDNIESAPLSKRMKDKYIILRFLGFYLLKSCKYDGILLDKNSGKIDYLSDIDDFLGKIMYFLNHSTGAFIKEMKQIFSQAMANAKTIFGDGCFRLSKYSSKPRKLPVNMALFESLSYLCADNAVLINIEKTKRLVDELFTAGEFINTISTNSIDSSANVNGRFKIMRETLEKLHQ